MYVPLPDFVIASLEAAPKASEQYFFWTGESKTESATGDWQRALKGVFKEAGIPDGHAHRFRDTFAVELLKAGVPMERVSVLLGHSSIKVTEKHYSPWVRARQEQLEADVRGTWGDLDSRADVPAATTQQRNNDTAVVWMRLEFLVPPRGLAHKGY